MKILVTGANGQLGSDICKQSSGIEFMPLSHAELDITDIGEVMRVCKAFNPDIIINTAAYVRVDDCETNTDTAYLVNADGAGNMAAAASETGAKLVHISTDYIFGGRKSFVPRPLTEYDTTAPVNVYGASKLAGEQKIRQLCRRFFIVRSSGLFGVAGSSGKNGNFVETIIRLSKERSELRIVKDQFFSPTYTHDLAAKILQLVTTNDFGIFHITNSGSCSWYEFAQEIVRISGLDVNLTPVTSDQYLASAIRPAYSVLDNYRLRFLDRDDMRSWQDALAAYMSERKKQNDK